MINSRQNIKFLATSLIVALIFIQISTYETQCAPSNSNGSRNQGKTNNNQMRPTGFLRGLFRRQTTGSTSTSNQAPNPVEAEADETMTQTEIDAQKFIDTIPGANSNKDRPSSLRERMSGTFGVLREGVSNHFRSFRDNWSDTVEDLRDTWSSS